MSAITSTEIKPCPFCGSTDLVINLWALDQGEVDAIECNKCLAGAPLTNWNQRYETNGYVKQLNSDRAA